MIQQITICLLTIINDALWTWCVLSVKDLYIIRAILFSMALAGSNAVITITYINNHYFIVPYILGTGIGTAIPMIIEKRKKQNDKFNLH